jgi:signal transduction histidine kinase
MAAPLHDAELQKQLWALRPGAHICCLFRAEDERRGLLAPFLRHGLERYERILYLADRRSAGEVLAYLSEDGVAVESCLQKGQLRILPPDACGLEGGILDPKGVVERLAAETREALAAGYEALRVSGDMSRALTGHTGAEGLVEFERRLNDFVSESRCLVLCPYDRRCFPPRMLLEIFETHPLAAVGTELFDNFYHLPPRDLLDADRAEVKFNSWLNHLRERRRAETQIRSLTRKLLKTQEDERCMISRELHDRVSQDLSTIKISLETLFDSQPAGAPEIRARVAGLCALVHRTIRSVRDLAYDLRPPGLDEMGIVSAMATVCEEFSEKTGIHVDYRAVGIAKLKLDLDTQITLYRMIQEGLNNIHRHADASEAVVKLTAAHPNVILRIEDNGRGFDPEKRSREIDAGKRMGLRSLQERTELLGGVMIVSSSPGRGTRILIKFPRTG